MAAEGVELIYSTKEFAVLGFTEVFSRLPFFFRAFNRMKNLVNERRPSVVVPIDYPGFNLRLADHCARSGLPVAYYVSPQVWAWGRRRVKKIRRIVSRMIVTFPFEEGFYERENVPVRFAGHPLIDLAHSKNSPPEFRAAHRISEQSSIISLFPGSREHEVESLLPAMIEAVGSLREEGRSITTILGAAPTLSDDFYRSRVGDAPIQVVRGETYEILNASLFSFVASGTMTVEAACLETPMAIVYKVSPLSWIIGRFLVRVDHVGMANLLADERVVPEFLQGEANAENLARQAREWLDEPSLLEPIRRKLAAVRRGLGEGGASRRAAEAVLEVAEEAR